MSDSKPPGDCTLRWKPDASAGRSADSASLVCSGGRPTVDPRRSTVAPFWLFRIVLRKSTLSSVLDGARLPSAPSHIIRLVGLGRRAVAESTPLATRRAWNLTPRPRIARRGGG